MKKLPHRRRYAPADVQFRMLKSRVDSAKLSGTYGPKIRRFLKGYKDAEVDRQTIDFIKVFLEWKERRAIRQGNHLKEFTQTEREATKNSFLWLAQRMQPELKPAEHQRIAYINLVKCRKITRQDIIGFIGKRKEWGVQERKQLFGRVSMFLDTIDHSNAKREINGGLLRYLGLTYPDRILLTSMWKDTQRFGRTAAHELGHKHYNLGEPLCHAIGTFYDLSVGATSIEKIKEAIRENNPDNPEGYLEGLAIVAEAVEQGAGFEKYFWEKVRRLATQKQHKWLPEKR